MKEHFGKLSSSLDVVSIVVDGRTFQKDKDRNEIVGYGFVSKVDLMAPIVPMTDRSCKYLYNKDTVTYRSVKAGEVFYLNPVETAYLLSLEEYNGICGSEGLISLLKYRYNPKGGYTSYFLKFFDSSSNPVSANDLTVVNLWSSDNVLYPEFEKSWGIMVKKKKAKDSRSRHNSSIQAIRESLLG